MKTFAPLQHLCSPKAKVKSPKRRGKTADLCTFAGFTGLRPSQKASKRAKVSKNARNDAEMTFAQWQQRWSKGAKAQDVRGTG